MEHRHRLRQLLVERSLELGDFVLAGGGRSRYYIDARRTTFSAEGQYLLGLEVLRVLREAGLRPDWIGGLTLGADPVACAAAHRSWIDGTPLQAFSIRKEPKGHGTSRQVEGGLSPGARVVVVEDTLTTGGSALRAAGVLEAAGARVEAVLTVVDREAGGEDRIRAAGYLFLRLYTARELLEEAGASEAMAGPGP
jgi:orotate phosphoribosyltransferase